MTITTTPSRYHKWVITVATGGALAMVPWTLMLASTLPERHTANHWTTTWVGFDVLLALSFAATALAIARRIRALRAAPVVSATLLLCDVWFDLTTASAPDLLGSVITGAISVPLAVMLIFFGSRTLLDPAARPTPQDH
jgi:hypothetical protein